MVCYIDDILITGTTQEEHLRYLEEVLKWLQKHGNVLKRVNDLFWQCVEYLGYVADTTSIL